MSRMQKWLLPAAAATLAVVGLLHAACVPSLAEQPPLSPTTKPSPAFATSLAGQQCPSELHEQYVATGPDGRSYATWHAPSDPHHGCWFGHEHGDDPTGSPALNGRTVLFGYAAAQARVVEPHAGFKVFRYDEVSHPNAPNHDGASVVMTLHQGTSGAARFTAVHHDVSVHYLNPTDGREVHVAMMAPFGTLMVACGANDPSPALRLQQWNAPGMRQVSADKCFNPPNIPYEDWITALYVGSDAQGNWKAYIDPHFAIFAPNTYCVVSGGACTLAHSDIRAETGGDPLGPDAHYKGTKREAYLNQVWLENGDGAPTIWTDAYGRLVAPNSAGAIAQYIAPLRVRPLGNSIAFGEDRVHDDGTVRAPN